MCRLAALFVLLLVVAGCGGSVTPGDDRDPVGAYRFSHGRTYGQLMIPEVLAVSSRPA
jgi:hypothetical protein